MTPTSTVHPKVVTGLDNLLDSLTQASPMHAGTDLTEIRALLRSGAVSGLVSNLSSITRDLRDAGGALLDAGVRLAALFGPEHGSRGAAAAGEKVLSERDRSTGLPVHSLYGHTNRPTPAMLEGIDLMIFDLQDVGTRFFTYIWTLSTVMEACADAGVPLVVLDRPNPLGGTVEGPLVAPGLESFMGRSPIPIRHGMTMGELARLFAERFVPHARVLIAPMRGWERTLCWADTGLPWAAPSPNLPTPETATIYPATCLLEGTNVSEGRGTPLPFRTFGAPWIDPWRLALGLERDTQSRWRALFFSPTAGKYSGAVCGGVEWYSNEQSHAFRPCLLGLQIIHTIKEIYPEEFHWRQETSGRSHFDLLIGRSDTRHRLDAGDSPEKIAGFWSDDEEEFRQQRAKFLLYP